MCGTRTFGCLHIVIGLPIAYYNIGPCTYLYSSGVLCNYSDKTI